MGKVIIGIHGLANKPEDNTLKEYWGESIGEGLKNVGVPSPDFQFKMVYWANYLYKYPMHRDEGYEFDKLYNDEPYIKATELKEYKESWKDELRDITSRTVGSGLDWFKNKFGIDRFADAILCAKLKDLDYYYQEKPVKDKNGAMVSAKTVLRQELVDTLKLHQNDEIMLIAHSMGSIIAYDVLRVIGHTGPKIPIKHFVTIGSPLGLPHVKQKVIEEREKEGRPEAAQVRTPTLVTGDWINYADKSDPVAMDTHLRDDYTQNDSNVRVQDDMVKNDYVGENKEPNAHKSYGYLRTPELSRQIKAFLT